MSNRNGRRRGQRQNGRGNTAVEQYNPNAQQATGAGRDKPWTFTWDGQLYRLPPAEPDTSQVTGGDLIDRVLGVGEEAGEAEMRLLVHTLLKAEPDQRTLTALRSMPLDVFGKTLLKWMRESSGVGPGESLSSST